MHDIIKYSYSTQDPLWIFKLLFVVYLGHPILFLGFLFSFWGPASTRIKAFKIVSTNTFRLNLALFVAITLPLYLAWLVIQVEFLKKCFPSKFRVETFLAYQTSILSLLIALPGLLNLMAWTGPGMEGNVFGFICILPMVLASLGYLLLWVIYVLMSLVNNNDNGEDFSPVETHLRGYMVEK